MGRPVDRSPGVVLVTDYGALDRALAQKARQQAKKAEKNWINVKSSFGGFFYAYK